MWFVSFEEGVFFGIQNILLSALGNKRKKKILILEDFVHKAVTAQC